MHVSPMCTCVTLYSVVTADSCRTCEGIERRPLFMKRGTRLDQTWEHAPLTASGVSKKFLRRFIYSVSYTIEPDEAAT